MANPCQMNLDASKKKGFRFTPKANRRYFFQQASVMAATGSVASLSVLYLVVSLPGNSAWMPAARIPGMKPWQPTSISHSKTSRHLSKCDHQQHINWNRGFRRRDSSEDARQLSMVLVNVDTDISMSPTTSNQLRVRSVEHERMPIFLLSLPFA